MTVGAVMTCIFAEKVTAMKRLTFVFIAMYAVLPMTARTETSDSIGAEQLNEVVVTGEKPEIKGQDGILVVDLPSIVEDKPVTNILEALGYLPGVVSDNGAIGLNGASSDNNHHQWRTYGDAVAKPLPIAVFHTRRQA